MSHCSGMCGTLNVAVLITFIMKLLSIVSLAALVTLSNGFIIAATRAVKKPGLSLSFLQKESSAKTTAKKVIAKKPSATKAKTATPSSSQEEWRWLGRSRDSKAPPLFLKTYDPSQEKVGNYPELKALKDYNNSKKNGVKRNPYQNNAPFA